MHTLTIADFSWIRQLRLTFWRRALWVARYQMLGYEDIRVGPVHMVSRLVVLDCGGITGESHRPPLAGTQSPRSQAGGCLRGPAIR